MTTKVIFFGTAELACPILRTLASSNLCEVVAAVTQPDRPKGRSLHRQPSPVKVAAQQLSIPVLQPERARHPDFIAQIRQAAPDLIVVVAFGQILPQALLDVPRFGSLNVHTSLLPRHRGAAPIQWAFLSGDTVSGITIMQMDAGLDTGPIIAQEPTPITPDDDAVRVHDRLATMGANLLVRLLPDYFAGRLQPQPQPAEGMTYARKITKEDGRIDWSKPAWEIWNQVRGLTPWPSAYTHQLNTSSPTFIKIWKAEPIEHPVSAIPGEVIRIDRGPVVACGNHALHLLELQRESGRRLDAPSFLLGHPLPPGTRLGTPPALNQPGSDAADA